MSFLVTLSICLVVLITQVHSHNVFLRPPQTIDENDWSDLPVYNVGDSIDIQWVSDFEYQDVILWQKYPFASGDDWKNKTLVSDSRSTSKIYTVTFDQFDDNVADGEWAVFKITLYNTTDDSYDAASFFNVTVAGKTNSSASGTAESAASSSGLSNGAVAGISVGATIVGIALLAGIGFFALRRMRKNNRTVYTETQQAPPLEEYKPDLSAIPPTELQGARPELSTGQPMISPLGSPYSQGHQKIHEAP